MRIKLHNDVTVTVTVTADEGNALDACNGAHLAKRKDSDAGQDADIIISDARPILSTAGRNLTHTAAKAMQPDGSIDWAKRAGAMKAAMKFYRACR